MRDLTDLSHELECLETTVNGIAWSVHEGYSTMQPTRKAIAQELWHISHAINRVAEDLDKINARTNRLYHERRTLHED